MRCSEQGRRPLDRRLQVGLRNAQKPTKKLLDPGQAFESRFNGKPVCLLHRTFVLPRVQLTPSTRILPSEPTLSARERFLDRLGIDDLC